MPSSSNIIYCSGINSFPTTKMESVNKLITENSLTRLINRLLDLDGYIITDGLANKDPSNSEVIGNGGKHLQINSDLKLNEINFRDNLFEFVIRGYYFSINIATLTDLITRYMSTYSSTTSVALYARIFIDNVNPNYPELVGQTEPDMEVEEEQTEDQDGKHYGVQFFLCPVNEPKPTPSHPSLDDGTGIQGLGTDYLYFDLMLMKVKVISNNNYVTYIPFDSLCKFDSHSINIIDGGELKLSDPEF